MNESPKVGGSPQPLPLKREFKDKEESPVSKLAFKALKTSGEFQVQSPSIDVLKSLEKTTEQAEPTNLATLSPYALELLANLQNESNGNCEEEVSNDPDDLLKKLWSDNDSDNNDLNFLTSVDSGALLSPQQLTAEDFFSSFLGNENAPFESAPLMRIGRLMGLPNPTSTTCYMNASLQALMACPSFFKYVCEDLTIKPEHEKAAEYIRYLAFLLTEGETDDKEIHATLANLHKELFDLHEFPNPAIRMNTGLESRESQNDAEGFISAIFESMRYTFSITETHIGIENGKEYKKKKTSDINRVLRVVFGEDQLKKTEKEAEVPIPLIDLIALTMTDKVDSASDPWTCEEDGVVKTFSQYENQHRFSTRLPAFIAIVLKRYSNIKGESAKIETPVTLPENKIIDLSPFYEKGVLPEGQSDLFECVAHIDHHGAKDLRSGHYTSEVRRDGEYFYTSDNQVEKITLKEFDVKMSYIMLFERKN